MAGTANYRQTTVLLAQLRETQQRVQAQIGKIENQLAQLEVYKIPDSQPYVTLRRVNSIEELAAPHKPLRMSLKEDLPSSRSSLRISGWHREISISQIRGSKLLRPNDKRCRPAQISGGD